MPGGDRTGPLGQGPRTGRGAGYCSSYGRGAVGGFPRGAVGGFGRRNRFYATGVPFSAYASPGYAGTLERDEEVTLLKDESQRLRAALESIEQRLSQLEAT
jgi:hypothetical protein